MQNARSKKIIPVPAHPTRALHTQLHQVCRGEGTQMESPSRGTAVSLCFQERRSKCRKLRPLNFIYLLHIWSIHCHSRCTFIIQGTTHPQCTAAAARSTPRWTPQWPAHCPRAALWQWCDESSPLGPGKREDGHSNLNMNSGIHTRQNLRLSERQFRLIKSTHGGAIRDGWQFKTAFKSLH